MWFSCFCILPGSAETQVIWGGTVKCLLIAYFIGNIYAKKCQNPFMCVKVTASQRWDVFWDTVYITVHQQETPCWKSKLSNPLFSVVQRGRMTTRMAMKTAERAQELPNLWSPYVIGQTIIFLPCGFFFLLSFFRFSSPNLSRRRLDVYHTSAHGVAVV